MPQTLEQALQQAQPVTDGQNYRLVKLPPGAIIAAAGVMAEIGEPFTAVIAARDEVTLVMPEEAVADFEHRLPGHHLSPVVYRLITFDVVLEAELVGFMARIATTLAANAISIMPYAAFTRDHILVAATELDRAMTVLSQLQANS